MCLFTLQFIIKQTGLVSRLVLIFLSLVDLGLILLKMSEQEKDLRNLDLSYYLLAARFDDLCEIENEIFNSAETTSFSQIIPFEIIEDEKEF